MSRRTLVPLVLAALLSGGAQAVAGGVDHSAAQVVLPFLAFDGQFEPRVTLENHETHDVDVEMIYVGERSSHSPGRHLCRPLPNVPALSAIEVDVRAACGLSSSDMGMLLFVSRDRAGVGRISARAVVQTFNPFATGAFGPAGPAFAADAIPLAQLDTTADIHVVPGLRSDPGASNLVTTDCFFGTFFDGSRSGGVLGRLTLKDDAGSRLGRDRLFTLKPFELVRFHDVFALVGAPAVAWEGVRAEFGLAGGGDTVLGYCLAESGLGRNSFKMTLAQVAEPQEETRRRSLSAASIPDVQAGGTLPFSFDFTSATKPKALHGLYVRHPDVVQCSVRGDGGEPLVIRAVAPDRTTIPSVVDGSTGEFGTSVQGYQGPADLWGLEVSWSTSAATPPAVASYSIGCRSGNGTSLADQIIR